MPAPSAPAAAGGSTSRWRASTSTRSPTARASSCTTRCATASIRSASRRSSAYTLGVSLTIRTYGALSKRDLSATRRNVELNAFYSLRDGTDNVVMTDRAMITTGYDEFDDPLNDISAYEDTIRRGTLQLAEQIRTRVAVFMTADTPAPIVPAAAGQPAAGRAGRLLGDAVSRPPPQAKAGIFVGMKLDKAKLDRVLKSPDSIGALLFYGPDEGLAHEYAGLAQKAVLGAGDDPFRLAELTPDDLKGDGARLADELNAISMLGGRRVVRIAQASNMIAEQIETAIAGQVPGSALLVVEAGDIGSKAELVKVFESADGAGVFACYRDNEAQLGPLIAAHLKAGGYGIARDALAYLAERLGGDRGVTRSELDKLMLYLGEPQTRGDTGRRHDLHRRPRRLRARRPDRRRGRRRHRRPRPPIHPQPRRSGSDPGAAQRRPPFPAPAPGGRRAWPPANRSKPPRVLCARPCSGTSATACNARRANGRPSRIGRALERLIEAESQAMRAYAIKDEIAQRALMDIATLARAGTARRS